MFRKLILFCLFFGELVYLQFATLTNLAIMENFAIWVLLISALFIGTNTYRKLRYKHPRHF